MRYSRITKCRLAFFSFIIESIFFLYQSSIFACDLSTQVESARIAGMGQTFTALADDSSAIWANPAGISRVRKNRQRKSITLASFPNIYLAANQNGRQFLRSYFGGASLAGDEDKVTKSIKKLGEIEDERICYSFALNPILYFDLPRGSPWVFGLLTSTRSELKKSNQELSSQVKAVSDSGVVLGRAWSDRNNRLTLGVQLRAFLRSDFADQIENKVIGPDSGAFLSEIQKKGNSGNLIAIDLGVIWTIADFWFPTIAFAIKNFPLNCKENYLGVNREERVKACGVALKGKIKNDESPFILDPTDIRFGFSLTPRISRNFAFRLAIDMHKGYIKSGTTHYGVPSSNAAEQYHAGLEIFFKHPLRRSPFAVRAGYNGVGVTGGLTLRFFGLTFDVATYKQKVQDLVGKGQEDSFLAGLTYEFR